LESAVSQPRHDYLYGGVDVFGIAASYIFHISQAQAFIDGNKRTAVSAAFTFLEIHGIDTVCDWRIVYQSMLDIAAGSFSKEDLAELLRSLLDR